MPALGELWYARYVVGPLFVLIACVAAPSDDDSAASFSSRRAKLGAALLRKGPSPQPYGEEEPPSGVRRVAYRSSAGDLYGWYAAPKGASKGGQVPGVVYAHGGFAFGASDFEDARPFLEGGAAVFVPTWRGENGNPGFHELFWGELDDLQAAVAWLARRPEVDARRIYVFGHSAGGVLAGLLSLTETRVQLTGSASGLYDETLFSFLDDSIFDSTNAEARSLRVLPPHVSALRTLHIAYVGDRDPPAAAGAATALKNRPRAGRLEVRIVPGDHQAMLSPAVRAFGARIGLDMAPGQEPPLAALQDLKALTGVPKVSLAPPLIAVACEVEACIGEASPDCRGRQETAFERCSALRAPGEDYLAFADVEGFVGEVLVCMAKTSSDPSGRAPACLMQSLANFANADEAPLEPLAVPAPELRKGHRTKLKVKLRTDDPVAKPPPELFRLVDYPTELGPMKAWLGVADAKAQRPAIVWITGGLPPGGIGPEAWHDPNPQNDQTAQAYRQAGFVMMYPTFRGSFGNPGYQEFFFGEADDALAAVRFLKKQPGVDPTRVYLGGHSTGGTLALIAGALAGDEVAGIIAMGPVADPQDYGSDQPFEGSNPNEVELRKPIRYLQALEASVLVVEGEAGNADAARRLGRSAGGDRLDIVIVEGADHFDYLHAAHRQIAERLLETGKLAFEP